MNMPRMRVNRRRSGTGSFPVREAAHRVLAHLYKRRYVLDGVEVLERTLWLGPFGCCHFRAAPSVARVASFLRSAQDGKCRGELDGALSPRVVAMWRVSLAMGCGHGSPDQMSLSMVRNVSSNSSFLTRRSLPILMAGIFCRSMSL